MADQVMHHPDGLGQGGCPFGIRQVMKNHSNNFTAATRTTPGRLVPEVIALNVGEWKRQGSVIKFQAGLLGVHNQRTSCLRFLGKYSLVSRRTSSDVWVHPQCYMQHNRK
jgi:hypothetical protein